MTGVSAPPVARRHAIGFFSMIIGLFLAVLDIQIVASSLGEIQAGLSASIDEIAWIQTSYLIAEVIMIPLSGFLSRMLSTRGLFALSAIGFAITSALCAVAWSIESMILFRALQGFIGGAMIPTVFSTSFTLYPGTRNAGATVVIGLVATVAPTIGPSLGGYITQLLSWPWLFLINVVPALMIAVVVWRTIDIDRPDRSLASNIDFAGLVLMALFLGSLEYVLEEGPKENWLEDETIAWLAATAALSGVLFVWRVLAAREPIVDLRAFRNRNFTIGSLYSIVIGFGLYGSVYLTPLYLGQIRGLNSLQIGEIMIVTGLFQFLSAPIAGGLAKILDLRVMLGIGLVAFAAGCFVSVPMTADWGFWELFWTQAIRGGSLMFLFLPINAVSLGTMPPAELKNASGLYNLMRNWGGALGLTLLNTLLIERTALHEDRLSASLSATSQTVQDRLDALEAAIGEQAGDAATVALSLVDQLVSREALVLTFGDCMLAMGVVNLAALALMPLVARPKFEVDGSH